MKAYMTRNPSNNKMFYGSVPDAYKKKIKTNVLGNGTEVQSIADIIEQHTIENDDRAKIDLNNHSESLKNRM